MTNDKNMRAVRIFIAAGRVLLSLSLISLLVAWLAELTGWALFNMSQLHLYCGAIALSLLGIGALIDAHWHARNF